MMVQFFYRTRNEFVYYEPYLKETTFNQEP